MATLLNQKSVASIGPIGVVKPTALLAKAEGLDAAAQTIDQLRARFLSDQVTDLDEANQDKLNDTLLRADERWTEEFYFQREKGPDGLAALDLFMENHTSAIVDGLPKSIQADALTGLTRLRLAQSGSLREEQYTAAAEQDRREGVTFFNTLVADVDGYAKLIRESFDGGIEGWESAVRSYADETRTNIPEGETSAFDLEVSKLINSNLLALSAQAQENFEQLELESFTHGRTMHLDNISTAIEYGASNAEIESHVASLEQFLLGDNFNQYASPLGAQNALRAMLYPAQSQILANEMIALIEAGDSAGADSLLARFRNGDPDLTDDDVLMIAEFTGATDLSQIANQANNQVGLNSTQSADNAAAIEANSNFTNKMDIAKTNPISLLHSGYPGAFSTNEVTDATKQEQYATERDENIRIGLIAANILVEDPATRAARLTGFANLDDDEQKRAVGYVEEFFGWSPEGFLINPSQLQMALAFYKSTGVSPPSVQKFLESAPFLSVPGTGVNALPTAIALAAQIRNTPGMSEADIGPQGDLYLKVVDQVGANASPELMTTIYNALERERAENFDARTRVNLQTIDDLGFVGLNQQINNLYHEGGEAELLGTQFTAAMSIFVDGLTSVDVSTGTSSLLATRRVYELLPEAYWGIAYDIHGNIFDQLGSAAGSAFANTLNILSTMEGYTPTGIMGMNFIEWGNEHQMIKDDLVAIEEGTRASQIMANAVRANVTNGMEVRQAIIMGTRQLTDEGYSLGMFAPESILTEGEIIEDTMSRTLALTQYPFEQFVEGNLAHGLREVLVSGQKWLRDPENQKIWPGLENLDLGDHLDQGRVTIEPVDRFNPSNPQFNVFVYPLDATIGVGKIPLFSTNPAGSTTFSYSGAASSANITDTIQTMQDLGITSNFVAALAGTFVIKPVISARREAGWLGQFGEAAADAIGVASPFDPSNPTDTPETPNENEIEVPAGGAN